MIYQIQREDIGRHTIRMGTITVPVPNGIITRDHVGKVLRYRRQRPIKQQVDIIVRETSHAGAYTG